MADFPEDPCEHHDVDVIHPDACLISLFDLDLEAVRAAISAHSAALRNPPISVPELLEMLSRAGVPEFAKRLGSQENQQG